MGAAEHPNAPRGPILEWHRPSASQYSLQYVIDDPDRHQQRHTAFQTEAAFNTCVAKGA